MNIVKNVVENQRLCYKKKTSNSMLVTLEDFSNLQNVKFIYQGKEILDEKLKEKYELPKYEGEDLASYKEKWIKGKSCFNI